ncbi:hypothetical protein [Sedimentisphaera salicampi]|uniref:hypothetical protein n=1 Tax=Sedimentisphaera salicampi TaxID=1941349 RepID=UPI000B9B4D02|nr:hypothetical protein [Sedimentisphaera salicampi]
MFFASIIRTKQTGHMRSKRGEIIENNDFNIMAFGNKCFRTSLFSHSPNIFLPLPRFNVKQFYQAFAAFFDFFGAFSNKKLISLKKRSCRL